MADGRDQLSDVRIGTAIAWTVPGPYPGIRAKVSLLLEQRPEEPQQGLLMPCVESRVRSIESPRPEYPDHRVRVSGHRQGRIDPRLDDLGRQG